MLLRSLPRATLGLMQRSKQCFIAKRDCVRLAVRSFLQRVFAGSAAPALLHFVKESKLTESELVEIRELLDAKLKTNRKQKKGSME